MQPVITPQEAARLEEGHDLSVLMHRAGAAVAARAVSMGVGYGSTVGVLCGPGNNGGDGMVAARLLQRRGAAVTLHVLAEPRTSISRAAFDLAQSEGCLVVPLGRPDSCDLVIDALFGVGFRGELPAVVRGWVDSGARILAVDVPSGLLALTGTDPGGSFVAEETVTFHALKTGHVLGNGPERSGVVTVANIGVEPVEAALRLAELADAPRPGRARTSHKWSAGSVVVAGGTLGMIGAAVLAGRASLLFGAGAVGLATPDVSLAQSAAPGLLAHGIDEIPTRYRVAVVGPGLGEASLDVVGGILSNDDRLAVVDAGALSALTPAMLSSRGGGTVLTPHADEFRRLVGEEPSPAAAREFAAATGTVVLLKGNPTFVTDGDVPWVVRTGGPELASIGTGDVLAGMIAALMARGLSPLSAAVSGAYWHGVAGHELSASGTVTAELLLDHIRGHAWDDAR